MYYVIIRIDTVLFMYYVISLVLAAFLPAANDRRGDAKTALLPSEGIWVSLIDLSIAR